MRNLHRIPVIFLCMVLIVILAGCGAPAPQETTAPTTSSLAPAEQYALAKAAVVRAENRILTYTLTRKRTIDSNTFSQTVTGTASYSLLGNRDMTVIVEDTLDFGAFRTGYVQAYCENKTFSVVNGCYFVSDLSSQEFLSRQIPALTVDEALYGSITTQPGQDSTVFSFTQPTALEAWVAAGKNAELLDAFGSAVLDPGGNLVQTGYRAVYRSGKVLYELELTVKVNLPKKLDLSAKHPAHGMDCVELEDPDIPRQLLQVAADVYTANALTASSRETIYSQAIPFSYEKTSQYQLSGSLESLNASASYRVAISDYRAQSTVRTQQDQFRDGVFTTRVNDGPEQTQNWVTAKILRQQYEDDILSALMAVKYLKGATLSEDGLFYRLELTGNESFCRDLMAGLSDFLEVNLDAQAQSWQTLSAGGYLQISKATGLPTRLGLSFRRIHTSDGVSYELTHSLDLSLQFS